LNKYNLPQLKSKFEIKCELETKIRQRDSENIANRFRSIYGVGIDFIKSE